MATIKFAPEKVFGMVPAETLVYKAGDEYLAGMIPAGMNRKVRIEALERAASDPTKSAEDRHKAWDDAGKLKAQEKAAKRLVEGNKD